MLEIVISKKQMIVEVLNRDSIMSSMCFLRQSYREGVESQEEIQEKQKLGEETELHRG